MNPIEAVTHLQTVAYLIGAWFFGVAVIVGLFSKLPKGRRRDGRRN